MDDTNSQTAVIYSTTSINPHNRVAETECYLSDMIAAGDNSPSDDDAQIISAAHAAANALNESDEATAAAEAHIQQQLEAYHAAVETPSVCCICGRRDEEGRPMLRFLPTTVDDSVHAAAPSVVTFDQDISLHIFCGKTASILPTVNRPDLEILTKAGLKNKHGIGSEVNAALVRTRCATLAEQGAKDKHYFLVREFEAHLAAIRNIRITFQNDFQDPFSSVPELPSEFIDTQMLNDAHVQFECSSTTSVMPSNEQKLAPVKAAAGQVQKSGRRYSPEESMQLPMSELTEDGKMRCVCGGTHLPLGTTKGVQSWRNHISTKRHQKWLEDQGMIGAV